MTICSLILKVYIIIDLFVYSFAYSYSTIFRHYANQSNLLTPLQTFTSKNSQIYFDMLFTYQYTPSPQTTALGLSSLSNYLIRRVSYSSQATNNKTVKDTTYNYANINTNNLIPSSSLNCILNPTVSTVDGNKKAFKFNGTNYQEVQNTGPILNGYAVDSNIAISDSCDTVLISTIQDPTLNTSVPTIYKYDNVLKKYSFLFNTTNNLTSFDSNLHYLSSPGLIFVYNSSISNFSQASNTIRSIDSEKLELYEFNNILLVLFKDITDTRLSIYLTGNSTGTYDALLQFALSQNIGGIVSINTSTIKISTDFTLIALYTEYISQDHQNKTSRYLLTFHINYTSRQITQYYLPNQIPSQLSIINSNTNTNSANNNINQLIVSHYLFNSLIALTISDGIYYKIQVYAIPVSFGSVSSSQQILLLTQKLNSLPKLDNWVSTGIQLVDMLYNSNTDKKISIIYKFSINTVSSLNSSEYDINYIIDKEIIEFQQNLLFLSNQISSTIVSNQKTTIYNNFNLDSFQWLSISQYILNQSNWLYFNFIIYYPQNYFISKQNLNQDSNANVAVSSNKNVNLQVKWNENMKILAVPKGSTKCLLGYNELILNKLYVIMFNVSELQLNATKSPTKIQISLGSSLDSTALLEPESYFSITSDCNRFRYSSLIYSKNNPSQKYMYTSYSYTQYDQQLNFAIIQTNLYNYYYNEIDSETYYKVINSTFYDGNLLYSNQIGDKVIVMTYKMTGTIYEFAIRAFYLQEVSLNWKQISTQLIFDISFDLPTVQISQNFQLLIVRYTIGSPIKKYIASLQYIDYLNEKLTVIPNPSELAFIPSTSILLVSNNYFYIHKQQTRTDNSVYYVQTVYYFDRKNIELVLINKMYPTTNQVYYRSHIAIKQLFKTLTVYYQVRVNKPASPTSPTLNDDTFILIQKQIGNYSINQMIHSQYYDVGIVIYHNQIGLCSPGCIQCFDEWNCKKCSLGFTMTYFTSQCIKCTSNCQTCQTQYLSKCHSCPIGYFLKLNQCIKCNQTCVTCSQSTGTSCLSCKNGHYLSAAKQCIACINNCEMCTNSTGCNRWKSGLVLTQSNALIQCPIGCTICKPNKIMQCISCRSGFQMIFVDDYSICKACRSNCKVCRKDVCKQCFVGYKLDQIGHCVINCNFPCRQCQQSNGNACTSCIKNYILSDKRCEPDLSCSSKYSCTVCPMKYYLSNGNCIECSPAVLNCSICNSQNPTQCLKCSQKYYLSDSFTCLACISSCELCQNDYKCDKCAEGYVLSADPITSTCVPCSNKCLNCFQSPNSCGACAQGYKIKGQLCISQIYLQFNLQMNTTVEYITIQQYIDLKADILSLINKKQEDFILHLQKIKDNFIKGYIQAESQTQLNTLYLILNYQFINGLSLGNSFLNRSILIKSTDTYFAQTYFQDNSKISKTYQSQGQFNVFEVRKNQTNTTFTRIYYDVTASNQISTINLVLGLTYQVLAISNNLDCAILIDNPNDQIYLYQFRDSDFRIQKIDVFNQVNSFFNTYIQMGNACSGFIAGGIVYRFNLIAGTSIVYQPYTLPVNNTAWVDPYYNDDLNIAIVSSGIFIADSFNKQYTLSIQDTIYKQKQSWYKNNHLIIFSYENVTINGIFQNYVYKIQSYYLGDNGFNFTKIDQFGGKTAQIPKIKVSSQLSKIIVYGKSLDGSFFYKGKNFLSYQKNIIQDLVFPSDFEPNFDYFEISNEFIYFRYGLQNQTQTIYQKGYFIISQMVIQAFSKNLSSLKQSDYVQSILGAIHQEYRTLPLIQAYSFDNGYSFEYQSIDLMYSKSSVYKNKIFSIPQNVISNNLVENQLGFQWIYTIGQGPTILYRNSYDPSFQQITQIQKIFADDFTILATDPELSNCAIVLNQKNNLLILQFDINSSQVKTVQDLYNEIVVNQGFELSQLDFQVTSYCNSFKINNLVYIKNNDQSSNIKFNLIDLSIDELTPPSTIISQKFNFALKQTSLYTLSGTAYTKIFEFDDLYSFNKLYENQNSDVIIILSDETLNQTTSFVYQVKVLYKAHESSSWIPFMDETTFLNGTTFLGQPTLIIEKDFKYVGIKYLFENEIYKIDFFYLDYDRKSILKFKGSPNQLLNSKTSTVQFAGNFLYYRQTMDFSSVSLTNYLQCFYVFNTTLTEIQTVFIRNLTDYELLNVEAHHLVQNNDTIKLIYKFSKTSTLNTIFKIFQRKISKDSQMRKTINQINVAQTFTYFNANQYYYCPSGCKICFNSIQCIQCSQGFSLSLSSLKCMKCQTGCKTCQSADTTSCISCFSGFWMNGLTCFPCNETCRQCQSQAYNSCTLCYLIQFLNENSTCLPCPQNCQSCLTSSICQTCKSGYAVSLGGECVKCLSNCVFCDANIINSCITCKEGFQLISLNNSITCQKCSYFCKKCSQNICLECRTGYKLSNAQCEQNCEAPCKQCVKNQPFSCLSCIGGYQLINGTCFTDLTCNQKLNCITCPLSSILKEEACISCIIQENCQFCSSANILSCESCKKGYFIFTQLGSQNICKNCSSNCLQCINQKICKSCEVGYSLYDEHLASKCLKCEYPCIQCQKSPYNCQTCAKGYTLDGWQCLSDLHIHMIIRIKATFELFNTYYYQKVEGTLQSVASKNQSQIHIISIKNGSIVLEFKIDASNITDYSNTYIKLTDKYIEGADVDGFYIYSVQFLDLKQILRNATTAVQQVPVQMYIIIGTTVGGGTIIILLTLLILYKKNIICKKHVQILQQPLKDQKSLFSLKMLEEVKQGDIIGLKQKIQFFQNKIERTKTTEQQKNIIQQYLQKLQQRIQKDFPLLGQVEENNIIKRIQKIKKKMARTFLYDLETALDNNQSVISQIDELYGEFVKIRPPQKRKIQFSISKNQREQKMHKKIIKDFTNKAKNKKT